MQETIKLLGEYFRIKKNFILEVSDLDEEDRKNHPFFQQELLLLQTCKRLEREQSLNSLNIIMMQWYYAYVEMKNSITPEEYVDFLDTLKIMRKMEQAERDLYAIYLSWLN